jgi:hypothetical protein
MRKFGFAIWILFLTVSCEEISPTYPDIPAVDYQGYQLRIIEDQLGNKTLVGRITFEFTDGDGNIGLPPLLETDDPNAPDTVKYNFFLQVFDLQGYEFVMVPESEGGILKYRIPYLDKQPLKGTMDLDISYPVIIHDTLFYTFYIFDRDLNRSNTDTTEVIVLSGIDLSSL